MLPHNEYETLLRRRSWRRDGFVADSDEESSDAKVDESLGMKLTLISGRVIVQDLNPLSDGLASPAQLTGVISVGDVLVMINSQTLRGLSMDKVLEALQVLSAQEHKELYLRFAIGEGVGLLKAQEEEGNKERGVGVGGGKGGMEDDLFSLAQGFLTRDGGFGFVDQLSGMPLFGEEHVHVESAPEVVQQQAPVPEENDGAADESSETEVLPSAKASESVKSVAPADRIHGIAVTLTAIAKMQSKKHISGFYELNTKLPELLRDVNVDEYEQLLEEQPLTTTSELAINLQKEREQKKALSEKCLLGMKALCDHVQENDERRDIPTSVFDLKSIKTTKSRGVFENIDEEEEYLSDDDNFENDNADYDHDEDLFFSDIFDRVWKDRLLYFLQNAVSKRATDQKTKLSSPKEDTKNDTFETDLMTSHPTLESLFFGSEISVHNLTSSVNSLPDKDVTAHLFDFTINITDASSADLDTQTYASSNFTTASRTIATRNTKYTQFSKMTKGGRTRYLIRSVREEATLFLLLEALPLWMNTFEPLNVKYRKMLFPVYQFSDIHGKGGGAGANDDASVMSTGSVWGGSTKGGFVEEAIEGAALDPEIRVHTCYLTTFYFTNQFFPKNKKRQYHLKPDKEQEACDFVKKYGAYLKLHPSLVAAAKAQSRKLTEELLNVAKYDPKHCEMMKELHKLEKNKDAIVLYEPAMLSALLVCLQKNLFTPSRFEEAVLPLFTTAYPDLKPWQVYDGAEEYTYSYLCLLLHPLSGSDGARKDKYLVQEWCKLSISDKNNQDKISNFLLVARYRDNMAAKLYYRDLPMLLDLAMTLQNHDLALDLVEEIIHHKKYGRDALSLTHTLDSLRLIAKTAIQTSLSTSLSSSPLLQRVLLRFNDLACSKTPFVLESISIPKQLEHLLEACGDGQTTPSPPPHPVITKKQREFLTLVTAVAKPSDALIALVQWNRFHCSPHMIPVVAPLLQRLLRRGAMEEEERDELSNSLRQLKLARMRDSLMLQHQRGPDGVHDYSSNGGRREGVRDAGMIWQKLLNGEGVIDK